MRPQIKISFKEENVADVTFVTSELPSMSNVANVNDVIEGRGDGFRGYQVSPSTSRVVSPFGEGMFLYSAAGYPGILTSALSDSSGGCSVTIPFHLTGNLPKYLYIAFDKVAKEYAEAFTLSNSANSNKINITNNKGHLITIKFSELDLPSTLNDVTFTLNITKWSRPNASIKITRLSTFYTIQYSGRDIKSFTNSENLLDAQMQIVPGICEQYANISVYDRYNVLKDFALANMLAKDYVVSIAAIDDVESTSYDMGNYIIADWDFESVSSTVGIICRDKSYLFEKINIERAPIKDRTLDELLGIMFSQAKGMSWVYKDNETRVRCEQIVVPNSWYHASDLYTMLNKLCALGMLRIYWYIDTFIVGRCC